MCVFVLIKDMWWYLVVIGILNIEEIFVYIFTGNVTDVTPFFHKIIMTVGFNILGINVYQFSSILSMKMCIILSRKR